MRSDAELFERWRRRPHHAGRRFILDGVISPELWEHADPRVLFVLREAYDWDDPEQKWDLPASIRKDRRAISRSYQNVALWAYVVRHAARGAVPSYPADGSDNPSVLEAFLSSAVVNIKKSGGRKTSDPNDIARFAELDADLLLEQIETYDPHVIVLGNVWYALQKAVFADAKRVSDLALQWRGRRVIDFWHPANQFPRLLAYYALAGILQNGFRGRVP